MAIVTMLLVKTPMTADGVTRLAGPDGVAMFSESILPLTAERSLRSINAKRTNGMKHEIERVQYDTYKRQIVTAQGETSEGSENANEPETKTSKKTAPKTGGKGKTAKKDPFAEDANGDVTI